MNYPLISEYVEAIKAAEDNFEQLKHLLPVLDDDGMPIMSGGNFAVVFKMKNEQTGKLHAVKCFLKEQEGRAEAYRQIAEELEYVSSTFLTPIKYLDKELFVDSSNSEDSEFPVLLMDWVEGENLDKYILKNKYDGRKLSRLVQKFHELSKWLLAQPFAHGDLKPDNIIVTNEGNLVLIDYDGMFVPKMLGQEPREMGTPNYRNPYNERINLGTSFSKRIDDFAIIHILLSLRIYSEHPHLITNENDFALFNRKDFIQIYETPLYIELMSSGLDTQSCLLFFLFQKIIYTGEIGRDEWESLSFEVSDDQYIDMNESMCSLDNIVLAVELAYSSMLFKDPARNEFSINDYKDKNKRISLAFEIQENLKMHEWPYISNSISYSCLKPNGQEKRYGQVMELEQYALRYLYGIVKYLAVKKEIPQYVYGGGTDVFTLNSDEFKYESYLDEFVQTQEDCAKKFKYLYVFDIRRFFPSVNMSRMMALYFGKDFTNVKWYANLLNKIFEGSNMKGLNPCSEVDFFFANIYLKKLDEKLARYEGIQYYRYGDDIRIFSNNQFLLEPLTDIIDSMLSSMSLELNANKTKLIDTSQEKIELAKACFVVSSKLYFGKNQRVSLLNNQSLAEIIENDLTTTYLFKLLNIETYENNVDVMFFILRNVHKNAALYKKVSEYIYNAGIGFSQDPMLFSYILKTTVKILRDEGIEPFVKYWVLRTFFCTDKQYYKQYIDLENYWRDQTWYPKPCYMNQISDILNKSFRKESEDELLYQISDYIISVIDPFEVVLDINKVDELPF